MSNRHQKQILSKLDSGLTLESLLSDTVYVVFVLTCCFESIIKKQIMISCCYPSGSACKPPITILYYNSMVSGMNIYTYYIQKSGDISYNRSIHTYITTLQTYINIHVNKFREKTIKCK